MSNCSNCRGSSPLHLPRNALSRRDVLKVSVAGAGLLALGPMARFGRKAYAAPRTDLKRLIVVNAFGGNDTTNMVIPTTLQPYYDRRGVLAIAADDAEPLDSGPGSTNAWVLHPAMAKIAQMYRDGDVAAIQKVGYPSPNLSHFESQEIFSKGIRRPFSAPGLPNSGWIARYADSYAPTPMGAVSVGVGRPLDFVGGASNPFLVNDLKNFKIKADGGGDTTKTDAYLHRLETAKKILDRYSSANATSEAKSALSQAHELADQVQAALAGFQTDVEWKTDRLSRQMKDIAVLIDGGFETQVFFTGRGGLDTHGGQGGVEGNHANRLTEFDDGIGDLAQDLKAKGLWNRTVIVLMTEFGRRNFVNGSDGTDHGHGFCKLVIGGKVKGGIYGPEVTEDDLNERYLPGHVDFRKVYKEIIADHLGGDPDVVFPEPLEINDDLGIMK